MKKDAVAPERRPIVLIYTINVSEYHYPFSLLRAFKLASYVKLINQVTHYTSSILERGSSAWFLILRYIALQSLAVP